MVVNEREREQQDAEFCTGYEEYESKVVAR